MTITAGEEKYFYDRQEKRILSYNTVAMLIFKVEQKYLVQTSQTFDYIDN